MDRQHVTGSAQIIRGNALDLALADDSVDLIVTSPPYFGLRSYQDGGEHYKGQIGDEATPAEFVDALVAATAEMARVLKPSGSIWVNLGDKYATRYASTRTEGRAGLNDDDGTRGRSGQNRTGVPEKSLIGVPWRYAIRCIDDLGLILRAEVIWAKPNGLPESVTDRVRRSHEQWFHFTKSPRYFSAVDEIREEHQRSWGGTPNGGHTYATMKAPGAKDANLPNSTPNPLGKLPGSVWTIPTQPLRVPESLGIDHFAAFPMEWPRRIIKGWAPTRGVCIECGEGRRPTTEKVRSNGSVVVAGPMFQPGQRTETADGKRHQFQTEATITGEACACPEPTAATHPAVILDPFGGTGTTALVAKALGCHGISNDMSADYCRLATWRTNDEGELARAMQVDKPAEQVHGQASLLDIIGDQEKTA